MITRGGTVALDDEQFATLLALLDSARDLDPETPRYLVLEQKVAHLAKTAKKKRRLARQRRTSAHDRSLDSTTGLVSDHLGTPLTITDDRVLRRNRTCYVCKEPYRELHGWYHRLCPDCGSRSEMMRDQPLDLHGRSALVTGGRVKIGFAVALQMLRAGATVHVTTRYPRDALRRYTDTPDASAWSDRLHIHSLDLRDLARLLASLEAWRSGPPFDILVNNAAQSVYHPPEQIRALQEGEHPAFPDSALPSTSLVRLPFLSLTALDLQRIDSWTQRLGEISPVDMFEVSIVNAIAPFLLVSQLRDNLARSPLPDRYIVNVSAVEGQFSRVDKSIRHPHTNMAKAALNMMTRTSASDLAEQGIYMVSVDPGWMSRETSPRGSPFVPPLEALDSAARILHPIAQGLAGEPISGVLLKDFAVVPW